MKLNETQKEWIEYYSNLGYSSREIERRTGVSKSACNYFLNGRTTPQVPQKDGPRVLLFDLESTPSIVAAFGRFKVNVPQDAVVKEGGSLISVCYKFLGDDKVTKLVQTPKEAKAMNDSRLVAELYVAFEEANIIVAHNCVHKNTPVLKKDLTWVPAYSLKEGDEVIAFEEGKSPFKFCRKKDGSWDKIGKTGRSLKTARVTSNFIQSKPCLKVTFANGDSVITTKDHYWLGMAEKDKNLRWYKTEELRVGQTVNKYFDVWETNKSYEAGWLSGFISGEGSLRKGRDNTPQGIQICQRPGETWDQAVEYSANLGLNLSIARNPKTGGLGRQDCLYADYLGGKSETLKILGTLQVKRLISNLDFNSLGKLKTPVVSRNVIVAVEDVGIQEVSVLSTSEKTFFAEGYPMHNCDKFDLPLFKTRLLANGFPPPPTVKTVDTLKIAKSMRFSSNKLDSLGSYLDLGRKVDHEGIKLWLDCMEGDKQALKKMLEYNEQDVLLLEKIYLKIRAFDTKPANAGQYFKDSEVHCPVCGSTDLTPTGNSVYTSVSEFPEVECNDCGHKSRTRSTSSTKETRSKLLVTPQK